MYSAYANIKYVFILFMASISLVACNQRAGDSASDDGKLLILSSFSIITDMVQEIGKDSVVVHNLVPIGTDPHEYKPVPDDIKFASKADLFLYNGLHLEGGKDGWFFRLMRSIDADEDRIIQVAKDVPPMYISKDKGPEEVNPHAFIDPNVGLIMAEAIRDILIKYDGSNKEYYKKNAAGYIKRLKDIIAEYDEKISSIPAEDRVFIASEQAFQYLTARYKLKEGFIWAIDTEENGSPNQIKHAIEFVKENKPPVLFVESNVDRRPMETVSKATGVSIYSPAIFSDELGKKGHEGDSYIKYLEYNLKHIYNGLTSAQ